MLQGWNDQNCAEFYKTTIRRKCFYTGETCKTRYINILWSLKIHELFQTVQYCFCLNNTEIRSERPLNYFTRSCIWVAKIITHHTTNFSQKMPQGKGTDTHLITRPLQILHIRLVVVWFVAQRVKTETRWSFCGTAVIKDEYTKHWGRSLQVIFGQAGMSHWAWTIGPNGVGLMAQVMFEQMAQATTAFAEHGGCLALQ